MRRIHFVYLLLVLTLFLVGGDCQPCEDPSQIFCA